MPVQQIVPTVQANTSWGDAITTIGQQIGEVASKAEEAYNTSKEQAGHNNRVYAQAVNWLSQVKDRRGISDDDFAKMVKQFAPTSPDEKDYDKRVVNPLLNIQYS